MIASLSGKTFVGNRASSLKESDKLQPYTKVTVTDGTNSYTSGDDTGRELTVNVPLLPTTKGDTLAANILAAVKNYRYQPYEAADALLDPAAELGDGVTVGGIYGGIHAKTTTFSRLFRATVSAPAEEEIDSEYPYLSAQERDAVRQKKQTAKNTADIAGNTASIGTLNTQVANISSLVADKASISSLNAAVARIGTLESNQITTSYLQANYCEINGATINGIKSRVANIEKLFTGSVYSGTVDSSSVATLSLKVGGSYFSGKTINYLGKDGSYHLLYVLGHE
nr:MAG TPA: hypothetical protein [Caudoviricetes sp.]